MSPSKIKENETFFYVTHFHEPHNPHLGGRVKLDRDVPLQEGAVVGDGRQRYEVGINGGR
jgi:hypothetical protein